MMKGLKFNLKNKLFLVILLALIFNILLSLVLGTTLIDDLYTYDKINNLKNGINDIRTPYLSKDLDKTASSIVNYEIQNISICIFSLNMDTGIGKVEYFTRQGYNSLKPFHNEILYFIQRLYNENAFNELNNTGYYIINDENNKYDYNITVLSKLEDNKYIFLQTPIKFIKDISDSAIKFSMYISGFTLLIGAALIYFISDQATKPIRKINTIANKISNLDFSDRCEVLTDDEIGLLSKSVNNMSEKLQQFISQLMVANEKLKDDLIRQEKTDTMRKQFIANVSHDFKTPLTLISSYSEALIDMKDIDDNTKIEYLNIIINESNKMSKFVHDLLKLSQLEGGIIKLEKSNFNINEIINDTIKNNSIIVKDKNLKIETDISNNSIVYADYYRIEQVFQNLFDNAVKYAPTNGKIIVSTIIRENKCIVKIFNTGNIISEEDLENIFISFYRADKSRKNRGSYGLGLAIVKVILDLHGENYGVQNLNSGVEFWFELERANFDYETEEN